MWESGEAQILLICDHICDLLLGLFAMHAAYEVGKWRKRVVNHHQVAATWLRSSDDQRCAVFLTLTAPVALGFAFNGLAIDFDIGFDTSFGLVCLAVGCGEGIALGFVVLGGIYLQVMFDCAHHDTLEAMLARWGSHRLMMTNRTAQQVADGKLRREHHD